MPGYEIEVPGKGKFRVEGPEGFTQEQAWQALQGQLGQQAPAETKTKEASLWNKLLSPEGIAAAAGTAAALPKVGKTVAKGVRKLAPEIVGRTAGVEPQIMRRAGEAGALGGPEAAEFRAGVAGRPSPTGQMTGSAGQVLPQRAAMAPFGQAGQELRQAGWIPEIDPKFISKVGAGYLGGVPWWASPALSPRLMGETVYGVGAAERALGGAPGQRFTRASIVAGATALLADQAAKRELNKEEIVTLRAARSDKADSETMLKAQRILQGRPLPERIPERIAIEHRQTTAQPLTPYGGTDPGQSVNGTRATVTPPSPGEASGPEQAQQAREVAAERMRRSAQPPGGRAYSPELQGALETLAPKTPTELGLTLALGPAGRAIGPAGRVAAAAGGFLMEPEQAMAGAAGAVKKGVGAVEQLWKKLVTGEGLAVPGKEYSKASTKALEEIKGMPKGAGPLELKGDLRSDVPQQAIPRYEPPRGLSPRMQSALANPKVIEGVRASMQRGVQMGADKWYHNEPIRKAFISELGEKEGPREFARFMDYTAATSPRSDVPTNIRNASYYYLMTGRELPEKLPYPYGHMAQALHRSNISKLEEAMRSGTVGAKFDPQYRGWDIFTNPKPVSFSEDLQGNLVPVAADTHAVRNITMRTGDPRFLETQIQEALKPGAKPSDFQRTYGEIIKTPKGVSVARYRPQELVKSGRMSMKEAKQIAPFWVGKPREGEYGAVEQFYGDLSKSLKLAPAEGQSAAWSGAGELTGLGTVPDQTFVEMFNNRVLYTSMMRGEKPEETLRAFIRKQKPLLGFGGVGLLGIPKGGKDE